MDQQPGEVRCTYSTQKGDISRISLKYTEPLLERHRLCGNCPVIQGRKKIEVDQVICRPNEGMH